MIAERKILGGIFQAHQLASWICRKYLRFVLLGAVSCCLMLNAALHAGAGLRYYCLDECIQQQLEKLTKSLDADVIRHIADNWVDPPFPEGTFKPDFDIDNPPWSTLGKWGEAHDFLRNYFKDYKDSMGRFVEIGAQDGEFMSFTLWVEQKKKFKGLLIEPNPYDYAKLRQKKRAAFGINACATPEVGHRKDTLWLRDTPDNLPPLLSRVQSGSNRLIGYVSVEDRDLGTTVPVQCFNAGAMILASLKTNLIDLMTISTHGGELDILFYLPLSIHIRILVVMTPIVGVEEENTVKSIVEKRELFEVFTKSNIHIFMPRREVSVV